MELNFYQTMSGNLVPSVVRLLDKVYHSGKRCVFYSPIEERVKVVDKTLWTFSTNAFVPHGDKELGYSDFQPIYMTSEVKNPNQAVVLVLIDSFDYKIWNQDFERVLFVFEDFSSVKTAEEMFSDLKNQQYSVKYWRQSRTGWEGLN